MASLESLTLSLSAAGRDERGWWFQLDIHGEGEQPEGVEVALYQESRRLAVGTLDGWGDWSHRLSEHPAKAGEELIFEIRSRKPRLIAQSAPIAVGGLIARLERERRWPRGESLRGADLRRVHLSGASLEGVDLREADLRDARLDSADLRGALLCRARLDGADLFRADLRNADLEGAVLEGTVLNEVQLEETNLRAVSGASEAFLSDAYGRARLDASLEKRLGAQREAEDAVAREDAAREAAAARARAAQARADREAEEQAMRKARARAEAEAQARRRERLEREAAEEARRAEAQEAAEAAAAAQRREEELARLERESKELRLQEAIIRERQESWRRLEEVTLRALEVWCQELVRWRREEKGRITELHIRWQTEVADFEEEQRKIVSRLLRGQSEPPKPPAPPTYQSFFEAPPTPPSAARKIGKVSFQLIALAAGQFQMGSNASDGPPIGPLHRVKLRRPLWVSATPITQALWAEVIGGEESPSWFKGEERPVESVSWWQSLHFCNRLSQLEGLTPVYDLSRQEERVAVWDREADGYRLLSEAEWEYAARAGSPFPYSSGPEPEESAWYASNAQRKTHRVAQREANPWGFYDFCGHVSEWVFDEYEEGIYLERGIEAPSLDPVQHPLLVGQRVLRGGSWSALREQCQVWSRDALRATKSLNTVGFRIARTITVTSPTRAPRPRTPEGTSLIPSDLSLSAT
ncbi:MAG: SUMF1/EgtB/PvdO family nonheme iron enzyme [Myxococcota bacterium]|nr:SUMF1/EgtB/PvdO family nonheme iron enzyme [Myxococcota bacterium]